MGDGDVAHDVVWWDPAALHLDVAAPFGLRREELIAKDVPPQVIEDGANTYDRWKAERQAALARGCTPWVSVSTMTEWAADDRHRVPEADTVTIGHEGERPAGVRFGTLVHAALATVPLDATPAARDALVATHGRIVGATAEEVSAAVAVVAAVLGHPLMNDARRAEREGRCYRELPVSMFDGDRLLEGVADLAFEIDGAMTVVDFKTDRAVAPALDRYVRQVAAYAEAIRLATGKPARAILLQV